MTRHRLTLIAAAAATLLAAGAAQAQSCPLPLAVPADSARPARVGPPPTRPACVDDAGKAHNCKSSDIDTYKKAVVAYNAAIESFNTASQAYVVALNAYVQSAHDYAHCQVQILAGKV
jgi:hypothetical protein